MDFNQKHIFMLQDKFDREGPVKHVKLISLEGGNGHVFHSVAKIITEDP